MSAPGHVPEHRFESTGGSYRVRVARPSDEDALRRMLAAAAPEDIRFRFFRHAHAFPRAMVEPLTRTDEHGHFAVVAEAAADPTRVVGSAMLVADPDGAGAEFGIFVARGHRGCGLGTHLLDCLKREAAAHGLRRIHGRILTDNADMIALARYYGFTVVADGDEPCCVRAEYAVPGSTP